MTSTACYRPTLATDPRPLLPTIAHAPQGFAHPNHLLYPLKRTGGRGEGQWQRVTWDDALDDIAERLQRVIGRYGPEGFAVASQWNTGTENGPAGDS
jgi:anaerobic selenocysteine-containing dehydrogenase